MENELQVRIIIFYAEFIYLVNKFQNFQGFEDGPGVYKEKILNLKQVASYDAFDGAPFAKETTES